MTHLRRCLLACIAIGGFLTAWQLAIVLAQIQPYMLPPPSEVLQEFLDTPLVFLSAAGHTLAEGACGLGLALLLTTLAGLAFAASPFIEKHVSSYLVSLQSIPVLAVAPLLTMWCGPGFWSKVAASVLVCFFPLAASWSVGIRSVPHEERDLFATMGATRWQTVYNLIIPRVLPFFFGGMRVAAPLSILGAIVGEFVGATGGLGFLILSSSYYVKTAAMFVCIILTGVAGLCAYKAVLLVERRVVFWQGPGAAQMGK